MKTVSLILLPLVLVLSVFSDNEWVWDEYGLAFVLPDDFEVETNDSEGFYALGDGMEFGIFPFHDDDIDAMDISVVTFAIADMLELDDYDEAVLVELNGLEGALVEGQRDGVRIVLLGIIDPETSTNFFATVEFYDDDEVAVDAAIDIINSIEPY
jgi:hypothetical protein